MADYVVNADGGYETALISTTGWNKKSELTEWEYDDQGREIRQTITTTYVED